MNQNDQAALIISRAIANFVGAQPNSAHLGTYEEADDSGMMWYVTRAGKFQYNPTDKKALEKALTSFRDSFLRSHPTKGFDRRIFAAFPLPQLDENGEYVFEMKWRLMDNEDTYFRQMNINNINLDTYWVDTADFPEVQNVSIGGDPVQITAADEEPEEEQADGTFHLLKDIGLYKQTIKERFLANFDQTDEMNADMKRLMDEHRQNYTLDELDIISAYMVTDRFQEIVDTYYDRNPAYFDSKVNALDLKNAEKAVMDYDKLRDFIDANMLSGVAIQMLNTAVSTPPVQG